MQRPTACPLQRPAIRTWQLPYRVPQARFLRAWYRWCRQRPMPLLPRVSRCPVRYPFPTRSATLWFNLPQPRQHRRLHCRCLLRPPVRKQTSQANQSLPAVRCNCHQPVRLVVNSRRCWGPGLARRPPTFSDSSDQHHKKDVAILALEAAFAEYGQ